MTNIAFHFNAPDKLHYACRLMRKAVQQDARVVVWVPDAQLKALDDLLWSFSNTDFLAHCRADSPDQQINASPLVLCGQTMQFPSLPAAFILVNLCADVCASYKLFERVIEIVSLDENDRQSARLRWKFYAQQGHDIVRHDLKLKDS